MATPWPFCNPRLAILQSSPPYYKGEKKICSTMAILQPLDSQYCSCVDHTIKEKKNCSCCYNAFYHSNALNR